MGSSSCDSSSRSGGRMRILEVNIKSASFSKDMQKRSAGGEIYAKLWIKGNERRKLKTGNLQLLPKGSRKDAVIRNGNNEFVFAVSHRLFVDNNTADSSNSSICFAIYRTRKYLIHDELIGRGKCDLGSSQFKSTTADDHVDDNGNYKGEARYDTDVVENDFLWNIDFRSAYGTNYEDEETEDHEEVIMSPQPELMKGSATVKVEKGCKEVMELGVEMVVWKGYVGRIGKCKFSVAMEKKEFMHETHHQEEQRRNNFQFAMCLCQSATKD